MDGLVCLESSYSAGLGDVVELTGGSGTVDGLSSLEFFPFSVEAAHNCEVAKCDRVCEWGTPSSLLNKEAIVVLRLYVSMTGDTLDKRETRP